MASIDAKFLHRLPHHERQNICISRAKYREGRRDTAVKVYTVNQESYYLLIHGVPAVGAREELQQLCEQYGVVDDCRPLDEYPTEDFTEVYLVKFNWLPAAKTAKKQLDDRSFFGGNLHVCYAPEFETIDETRKKLQERRKFVAFKTKQDGGQNKRPTSKNVSFQKRNVDQRNLKNITNPTSQTQPISYIWAGKEYTVHPPTSENSSSFAQSNDVPCSSGKATSTSFLPRQLLQKNNKRTLSHTFSSQDSQQYGNEDKESSTFPVSSFSETQSNFTSASYSSTVDTIREKLKESAAPVMQVSFKRKKK